MFRYRFVAASLFMMSLALLSAAPLHAADVDKYLPADADVVVTINVRQILDSGLLIKKESGAQLKQLIENTSEINDVLKGIGLDPLRDIDQVVIALPVGKDQVKVLALIHGRFNKAKIEAVAEKAANEHADHIKIHTEGDTAGIKHTVYEVTIPDAPQPIFVGVADKGSIVLGSSGEYVVEALAKAAPGKKTELKNKELQALLQKVDGKQSITITAPGAALTKVVEDAQAKALLEKLDSVSGGINIADDIKLEILVTAKTAEGAKELNDAIKDNINKGLGLLAILASDSKQLAPVLELVKSIKTTTRGNTITIKGELSADQIEQSMKKDK